MQEIRYTLCRRKATLYIIPLVMLSLDVLLMQLDVNDIERSIIQSCVHYGFISVGTIARYVGLPRTTVYDSVAKLVQSGYLIMQTGSRGQIYGLASIETITRMLSDRMAKIEEQIQTFKDLGSMIQSHQFIGGHIPQITYHEGKAAILSVYEQIYQHEDIMTIFDPAACLATGVWTEKELLDHFRHKSGTLREILLESPIATKCLHINKKSKNILHEVRIGDLSCTQSDTLLLDGTVYHISFHQPLVMIEIRGESYYQVQKTMFEALWNSL